MSGCHCRSAQDQARVGERCGSPDGLRLIGGITDHLQEGTARRVFHKRDEIPLILRPDDHLHALARVEDPPARGRQVRSDTLGVTL